MAYFAVAASLLDPGNDTTRLNDLISQAALRPPRIVDGLVTEQVGDTLVIWVVAPVNDHPTLTQGSVFSYYEFGRPMSDCLTDEAWQAMGRRPDQPIWTGSFIVP